MTEEDNAGKKGKKVKKNAAKKKKATPLKKKQRGLQLLPQQKLSKASRI